MFFCMKRIPTLDKKVVGKRILQCGGGMLERLVRRKSGPCSVVSLYTHHQSGWWELIADGNDLIHFAYKTEPL